MKEFSQQDQVCFLQSPNHVLLSRAWLFSIWNGWKRMWDLPIVWSPHQAGGAAIACPKPTSISWMQVFPGWLTVKRAQHWAHLSISWMCPVQMQSLKQSCRSTSHRKERLSSHPRSLWVSHLWAVGVRIFLHNLTEGSLWISQQLYWTHCIVAAFGSYFLPSYFL